MHNADHHITVAVVPCGRHPGFFTWEIRDKDRRIALDAYSYHRRWAARTAGETALYWYLQRPVAMPILRAA